MTDTGTRCIRIAGATDTGRRRPRNEDALDWRLSPDATSAVAVVADGVGGQPGGDRASALTVEAALATLAGVEPGADAAAALERAFAAADGALQREQASDPDVAAMATTLVAAVADTRSVSLGHVGDSRAYRLHQGELVQLTRDHTVAQQMVDDGVLGPEQRDKVPFAHVLSRAMDGGGREPELARTEWDRGDRLLLCSDGLNAVLDQENIVAALAAADPQAAVQRLIDESNRAGGPDNITVIVMELR